MSNLRATFEWRVIATLLTFLITYIWTGKFLEATGLTIALNLSKTIAFYFWNKYRNKK